MVELLMAVFEVPKGIDHIRLVYDGSIGGSKLSIWMPSFFLSIIKAHLCAVDENTYTADVNIG
jgi:hypothetical protein